MREISFEVAMRYFEYRPKDGKFFRKLRPRDNFKTDLNYSYHLSLVGRECGYIDSKGYVRLHVGNWQILAHRMAWLLMTGELPKFPEYEIDHIDGNPANNSWDNLRKVTKSQNQRNAGMRRNNKSGVHGVYWHNSIKRWVAGISVNDGRRQRHLGVFDNIQDAARARALAEIELGYTRRGIEPKISDPPI